MTEFFLEIQIISILAIIVPAGIALRHLKTAGSEIRLFFLFLVVGLLTDVTMFYLVNIAHYESRRRLNTIFNFYCLVESLVFFWFILKNIRPGLARGITSALLIITVPFWLFFIQLYPHIFFTEETAGQRFSTFYEISAAFLSGFALLQLVEREENFSSTHTFWILVGIFFYCFSTFFIMGFVNTVLSMRIWFLNNIFNIITMVLYAVGLSRYRKA